MGSKLLVRAYDIVTLAKWPGSIQGWIEKDVEQFPAEGTLMHQFCSAQYPPEAWRLTREQGQELLWASEAALEILRREPELLKVFLRALSPVLRDDYDQIARIVLLTLEPLADGGRIKIPYEAVFYAGFAYLFVQHCVDGVVAAAGLDVEDFL